MGIKLAAFAFWALQSTIYLLDFMELGPMDFDGLWRELTLLPKHINSQPSSLFWISMALLATWGRSSFLSSWPLSWIFIVSHALHP